MNDTNTPTLPVANRWLNGLHLANALGCGEWVIYGVKKANKIFHQQGLEPLIFTGRLSTPAKIAKWLRDHPDFIPNRVLAPIRKGQQGTSAAPARQPPQQRPAA